MPRSEEHIMLRSEEVNEILTSTPAWIFRWGTYVICLLILIASVLSCFIRYPDILIADVTLTTLNPPINLVSRNNGKITELFVKDGEKIHAGEVIAVIENTADLKDVLYLSETCTNWLQQLKAGDSIPQLVIRETLKSGELTPDYLSVLKSIRDLHLYRKINLCDQQVSLLKRDLVDYNGLLEKYKKQLSINSEEMQLTEKDFARDKQLFSDGVISAREFENKKREYLKALNANESVKITLSNSYIQINTIEKNILQLQIQDFEEREKLKNLVQQSVKSLLAAITDWKRLYLIESPVDGKISFFKFWTINQDIKTGDELFYLVPDQKQKFIGKCLLPAENSGKLALGQHVSIRLNNYPHSENGVLNGGVVNISEVPNENIYSVDVELKNGLLTSYNTLLPYKEEMTGKAHIVTRDLTVMERIFFNFRKLVERN